MAKKQKKVFNQNWSRVVDLLSIKLSDDVKRINKVTEMGKLVISDISEEIEPLKSDLDTFINIETKVNPNEIDPDRLLYLNSADINEVINNPEIRKKFIDQCKVITGVLDKKLQEKVEIINSLNLVWHATYFQNVNAVEKLIDISGVNINQEGKTDSTITGGRPLDIAARRIDTYESQVIFDGIARKLVANKNTNEKTDEGNWVNISEIDPSNTTRFEILQNRLKEFLPHFHLDSDLVFSLFTKLTIDNVDNKETKESIKDLLNSSLKHIDISLFNDKAFVSKVLNPCLAFVVQSDFDQIDEYKLELITKYSLMTDVPINKSDLVAAASGSISESANKFLDNLIDLQNKVIGVPKDQKTQLREFVLDSGDGNFSNLISLISSEKKLLQTCNSLKENPSLFKSFLEFKEEKSFLKPCRGS